ncbi:MAG: cell division protein ZapA, partial [Planktomarina sp.]|nr:cell division protein ZapA [Planktomarina sp.]
MPNLSIKIGGRSFSLSCQSGEEAFLEMAASMLNTEAMSLADQSERMPESQMLLMSGLLLADRTVSLEEKLKVAEKKITNLEAASISVPPEISNMVQKIEVQVVPPALLQSLAELSARAESAADSLEEKTAPTAI